MERAKQEFIEFLQASGSLRFGDFTLKSGEKSPFFINMGDIVGGAQLLELGRALAGVVCRRFPEATILFGPAYKGISLATATACACSCYFGQNPAICYDRKEAKQHGEGGLFIGRLPTKSDCVVVIDDVVSSGTTKLDALNALKAAFGVEVAGIVVAVDRRRKGFVSDPALPPIAAMVTLADVASYLREKNDPRAAAVEDFYNKGP
jgi:orotate phosphoribosyltransferase